MIGTKRGVAITVIACMTTIVSHSIGRSIYGLLLPAIEDDLGLTYGEAGLPSSGIFVLYIIGVLIVAFVSAHVEPITIMRIAFVISIVGLFITATAANLSQLVVGVSLVGGAGAGIWMTAPVLATAYVSERRRGLVIGALTSSMGLANVALGFGTTWMRRSTGDDGLWRPVWWIALGFTAALLVALVVIAQFPKTDRVDTSIFDLKALRSLPRWREITLAYALFGGMAAGFSAFIVAALEDHGGLSSSASATVFSLVGIASMVSAPGAGALSDHFGRITMLRVALLLLVIAAALVAAGGRVPVILGALIYGAGASSVPALVATYVRDSLDSRSFSRTLALMTILFSVAAAIVPTVVGQVADLTTSFRWPYVILAALPVTALAILGSRSAATQ